MVNVKPKTSSQHGAANKNSAVSSHTAKKASKNPISVKKCINNTYNIYTAYKNDTILISYGDGYQKTLQLTSSKYFKNFLLILMI